MQHLQAFCMSLAAHHHHIVVVPLLSSNCHRPIAILQLPSMLPLPLPPPLQMPLPLPFAIAVAIAVAITIAVAATIANAVIAIFPLVCPLCFLFFVLSGGQSHCYQQWCRCCCHGRYVDDSIVVAATAALDNGISPLPSNDKARHTPSLLQPTTTTAIRAMAVPPCPLRSIRLIVVSSGPDC